MPAAIDSTTRARRRRTARARRTASRICCGLTASTTSVAPAIASRVVRSCRADAGEARRELRALLGTGLDDREVGRGVAVRDQSADERGRHVAAADERDAHCTPSALRADWTTLRAGALRGRFALGAALRAHAVAAARAPKIAVPMRTSVAPSAIAASMSSVMPIDSVSAASPAARASSRQRAQRRELRALPRRVGRGLAMPMNPRKREPRQRRDRPRERHRLARRDAALGRLVADVDLHADLQRRAAGRALRREALGDLQAVDALHPVERRGGLARLVALQRADEVPGRGRQVGELARSWRHASCT